MPDSAPQPSPLPTQGAYWGRLAPSPTGYLHIGHARTFAIAAQRASAADGRLLLRNDDLDVHRCRPEFVTAFVEDLNWLGLAWQPPIVSQSARIERYREVLEALHRDGLIFPCSRSRKDVLEAASAPHEGEAGLILGGHEPAGSCGEGQPGGGSGMKEGPTGLGGIHGGMCWEIVMPRAGAASAIPRTPARSSPVPCARCRTTDADPARTHAPFG